MANSITRTYSFANGGVADGGQVDSEIANIVNAINNADAGTTPWTQVKTGVLTSTGVTTLKGTTTSDSAGTGNVGEVLSATRLRSAASSLTSATALDVTSLSLTSGDWDVRAMVGFSPSGTTSVTIVLASISTTSATVPGADTRAVPDASGQVIVEWSGSAQVPQDDNVQIIPSVRISLASTTTYYLVARSTFTVSTHAAYGSIIARRIR